MVTMIPKVLTSVILSNLKPGIVIGHFGKNKEKPLSINILQLFLLENIPAK